MDKLSAFAHKEIAFFASGQDWRKFSVLPV